MDFSPTNGLILVVIVAAFLIWDTLVKIRQTLISNHDKLIDYLMKIESEEQLKRRVYGRKD